MGRWGKFIVVSAVLVILGSLLVPLVFVVRYGGKSGSVRKEISRIESEGLPVSAADLAGRRIPDTDNAAVVYGKALSIRWAVRKT